MPDKETKPSIYAKLLEVQKEIGAIKKDKKNPHYDSSYADINTILDVVKPILNKHGLVLNQPIYSSDQHTFLLTRLTDAAGGDEINHAVRLPDIQDPQKMGSAITYYRRYSLVSLLALEAEDDDGQAASQSYHQSQAAHPQPRPQANGTDYGPCTLCGKGRMTVKHRKSDGKPFLSCNNYPACRNSSDLPPAGQSLEPSDQGEGEISPEEVAQMMNSGPLPF